MGPSGDIGDTKAGGPDVKSWKGCGIAVDPEPSRLCINIHNNSIISNLSDKYRKKWKEKLEKMTRKMLVNQTEVNREVYKGEKAHDTANLW